VRRLPDSAALHASLGDAAMQLGDAPGAVRHYREAFRREPGRLGTGNNLAWLLATSDADDLRNPQESIEVARQILSAMDEPDPNTLDTLAAGLAAAERFEEALEVATRAEELARLRGDAPTRDEIARRLALYRTGLPYVERLSPADG
jgi:tetratricopeptide (TPR) repeat protein